MGKKSLFEFSDAFINAGAEMLMEMEEEQKQKIREFLKKQDVRKYSFHSTDDIIPEVTVDVEGSIKITKKDLDEHGCIPIPFGKVSGSFICNDCGLTSLSNAPDEVGDIFCCSGNKLESLKGCPGKVGISFECASNAVVFSEEDIKQVCKVGRKVKTYAIKSPMIIVAGYDDFPTKTKVDKFRFTTFDKQGLGISFHISSSYMKGNSTLMVISYWTKYSRTNLFKEMDGLESLPKEECERFRQFLEGKMDALIEGLHLDQIDWYNWDIPTSQKSLYEDGHSPLDISIPDHPSLKMETMFPYIGDGWLNGAPVFELDVKPLFYK